MKRLERLRLKRRKRIETAVKAASILVLVAGLVLGIVSFDSVKTWAAKHYFKWRWSRVVMSETEENNPYSQLTPWIKDPSQPLNILFIGIDRGSVPGEEGYTRSDVMIIASLNIQKKKAVLVSIPRDTKVTIPGYGTQKINAAHSFGGPAGAVEAAERLSGLEINHYAEVDFEAFKKIVDAIGGVPFHLEHDILDPKVGALGKGDLILNGEQALIVCRTRDLPEGDLDRIENQKRFLKAVMEKVVSIRDVQALLGMLDAAVRYLETTLEPDLIFELAEALRDMKVENVEFATLPGDEPVPKAGQPWYYVVDEEAAATLFRNVALYCSARTPEEQAAEEAKRAQEKELAETETAAADRSAVDLAVLNGVRQEGVAARVAELLEGKGYRDISVGNTVNPYENTTVYYAPGHEAEARLVARDLAPDGGFIIEEDPDVAITYDAAVILVIGKDYAGG